MTTLAFEVVSFFVRGKPEPAGSKRAVSIPGRSFTQVVDANKRAAPWKQTVAKVAAYEMHGSHSIIQVPCACRMDFVVKRPAGHWRKGGGLSAQGLRHTRPGSKPDVLKLARGVEDAMAGVVYIDDALICHEVLNKRYQRNPVEPVGVQVYVWPLRHDPLHDDDGLPAALAHRASPRLRSTAA